MMIAIDIIVLCIIAGSFIYGYKKGLINIITSVVGFLLAIILASIFSGSLASYFKTSTPIYTEVSSSVKATIEALVNAKENEVKEENKEEVQQVEIVEGKNVFTEAIADIKASADNLKQEKIVEYTEKISNYIVKAAAFICIYLVVLIIADILNMMLNGIFSLPLLDSVNKMSGMLGNGLITIIKIQIFLAIIYYLSGMSMMSGVIELISKTKLLSFLYENNLVCSIIKIIFG